MNTGRRTSGSMGWMAVVAVTACVSPATHQDDSQDVVQSMLERSAAAWNRGDLSTFLSDYAPEASTTFVSGGRVQYGFNWISENYAPSFDPGAQRDSLRFEAADARPIGDSYILATARFVLFRGDSVTASGPFTLVLRYADGTWKIIHDHTSRDP